MAIVGLGTDLVRTARFQRYIEAEKHALLERLFTPGECAYAMQKAAPAQHFAARFAAKEACLKAFGLGLRDGIRWLDIEVVPDMLGRPELRLSGRAGEIAAGRGVTSTYLSFSHDGDYAVATVVLEKA